ncbi:hypothetical protein A2U01_0006650 [Trifolium medium]|uniref:Uncharacterized protein n=1 Tax=Trifolium medium TaxID=97028 RepID=A0A392MFH8_9FABA|nr:hypothetical protein [Trifolium medium]
MARTKNTDRRSTVPPSSPSPTGLAKTSSPPDPPSSP